MPTMTLNPHREAAVTFIVDQLGDPWEAGDPRIEEAITALTIEWEEQGYEPSFCEEFSQSNELSYWYPAAANESYDALERAGLWEPLDY